MRMGRPQVNDLQKMATELVSTSILQAGAEVGNLHDRVVALVERYGEVLVL